MANTSLLEPDAIAIWGCDWRLQYERNWILSLLGSNRVHEHDWSKGIAPIQCSTQCLIMLIESGIHTLGSGRNDADYIRLQAERNRRLEALQTAERLIIIHLSDEEGHDGDSIYASTRRTARIYRNYQHSRFNTQDNIHYLPLGPTKEAMLTPSPVPSSQRRYKWSFMGTAWPGTDREDAVRSFKSLNLEDHFLFLGNRFGQGINKHDYIKTVSNSAFTPCPQGDRHIETFRFYEALELGSIPLSINAEANLQYLFPNTPPPLPLLQSWQEASAFTKHMLSLPFLMDKLQSELRNWWEEEKVRISHNLFRASNMGIQDGQE